MFFDKKGLISLSVPALIGAAFFSIIASTPAQGQSPQGNAAVAPASNANVKDISPESRSDRRFQVRNMSFDLKVDPTGKGEILEVIFELRNATRRKINLKGYVIAYYETDMIDRATRDVIPYPIWRAHDPAQNIYIVREINISPANVDQSLIWNEKDPDYRKTQLFMERVRDSVSAKSALMELNPPVSKYVSYLAAHADQGISVSLYGFQGPTRENQFASNFVTKEEAQKQGKSQAELHTYTLEYHPRMTVVRTHHMQYYHPEFRNYNTVAVLLFDEDLLKQSASGQKDADPIVFYRTYRITQSLRVI